MKNAKKSIRVSLEDTNLNTTTTNKTEVVKDENDIAQIMSLFAARISNPLDIVSTEDFSAYIAAITIEKKSSVLEKHILLKDIANEIGSKLLVQYRKKDAVHLTSKKDKESIVITYTINVHTKEVQTKFSTSKPKKETAKAEKLAAKDKVQQKTISISSKNTLKS